MRFSPAFTPLFSPSSLLSPGQQPSRTKVTITTRRNACRVLRAAAAEAASDTFETRCSRQSRRNRNRHRPFPDQ